MQQIDKEIILAYADCSMNKAEVARRLYFNPLTISYHFRLIERETGLNPKKFYDLIKLVEMVKGEGN